MGDRSEKIAVRIRTTLLESRLLTSDYCLLAP